MKFLKLILVGLIGANSTLLLAADIPSRGIAFNTKESSSITYDCLLDKSDKLRCDFIQTSIRKKLTKSEFLERMAKIPEQYKKEKASGIKNGEFSPPSPQECASFRDGIDILSGKKPAPNGLDVNASLTTREIEDNKRIFEALIEVCVNPVLQSFVNISRVGGERELKTCQVASSKYSQVFKRVRGSDGKEVWVVESSADGDCGAVRLDTFSADVINGHNYWNYKARKVITNPNGKMMGMECSKFDQDEYLLTCPGIFRPREIRDNGSLTARSGDEESTIYGRTDRSHIARS